MLVADAYVAESSVHGKGAIAAADSAPKLSFGAAGRNFRTEDCKKLLSFEKDFISV